jgi:hypothetical protein
MGGVEEVVPFGGDDGAGDAEEGRGGGGDPGISEVLGGCGGGGAFPGFGEFAGVEGGDEGIVAADFEEDVAVEEVWGVEVDEQRRRNPNTKSRRHERSRRKNDDGATARRRGRNHG